MTPAHAVAAVFDELAPRYDAIWTDSAVGRLQRNAVWLQLAPLVKAGDTVLDLGCGTGEDAAWLRNLGASVTAIDASPEMVRRARARGVDARVLAIEEGGSLGGSFHLVLSNFGALNCVRNWTFLKWLVRPGGYAVLCVIGRFCFCETAWYAARSQVAKAVRRWRGAGSGLGIDLFYPSVRQIRRALAPEFRLLSVTGIGVCVPPSYIRRIPLRLLRVFGEIDRLIASWPIARSIADHRLLVLQRT